MAKKAEIDTLAIAFDTLTAKSFNYAQANAQGGISDFGYVNTTGQVTTNHGAACHYGLQYFDKPSVVFSWHKSAKPYADLNMKFLTFLLDPVVSPWREILLANPPKQLKPFTKNINTPGFVYDHGFLLYTLTIPGNLLGNFLIASRWIWEHMSEVETWDKLVTECGIHPAVALFLSAVFIPDKAKFQIRAGYDPGHHALNLVNVGTDYFENFCKGQTANRLENYDVRPGYVPCNTVWGKNVGGGYDHRGNRVARNPGVVTYLEFLTKEYLKEKTEQGKWGGPAVKTAEPITFKELGRIAQAEQQRIGL